MLQTTEIKVIAIFTLLGSALLFGLTPLCFISKNSLQKPEHRERFKRVMGWLSAFAGGVFMAIAMIHLLPQAREMLKSALEMQGMMYNFNWAELIAAGGFFFIVFVEQIVYICQGRLEQDGDETSEKFPFARKELTPATDASSNTQSEVKSVSSSPSPTESISSSECRDDLLSGTPRRMTSLRAVILLISLSIHSIFEGLAIGLQMKRAYVIDLFIAIAIHKGIEAFTISINLAQTKISFVVKTVYSVVFALMSPVGVALGIPIVLASQNHNREMSSSSLMINAVLQAVATGTFMFVTFIEILPQELNSRKDGLIKFVFVVAGFGVISLLNAIKHPM